MSDDNTIQLIRKRDGRVEPFNPEKITDAIFNSALAVGGTDKNAAQNLKNTD